MGSYNLDLTGGKNILNWNLLRGFHYMHFKCWWQLRTEDGLKQKLNTNSDLISKYRLLSCIGKPTSHILTIIHIKTFQTSLHSIQIFTIKTRTDHWFLELVGFDTTYEKRLTTTQSFHKQIQRLLELSGQCWSSFPCFWAHSNVFSK